MDIRKKLQQDVERKGIADVSFMGHCRKTELGSNVCFIDGLSDSLSHRCTFTVDSVQTPHPEMFVRRH